MKVIFIGTLFLCWASHLAEGCWTHWDCGWGGWCKDAWLFHPGHCQDKQSDGAACYNAIDVASCTAGVCLCGKCGSTLPNYNPCSFNHECKSGWCQGYPLQFPCLGQCEPKRADGEYCQNDNAQCRGGICHNGRCKGESMADLLALCADNVYYLHEREVDHRLKLIEEHYIGEDAGVQWALYGVQSGVHAGKTIMAFRGTDSFFDGVVDAGIGGGAMLILSLVTRVEAEWVKYYVGWKNPDFVTGHSLGGFYAEIASATFGKPGASFNAPGPWGLFPINSFIPPFPKYDVGFAVHLTRGDVVSELVGSFLGVEAAHVSKPLWHTVGSPDLLQKHAMTSMLKHFTD